MYFVYINLLLCTNIIQHIPYDNIQTIPLDLSSKKEDLTDLITMNEHFIKDDPLDLSSKKEDLTDLIKDSARVNGIPLNIETTNSNQQGILEKNKGSFFNKLMVISNSNLEKCPATFKYCNDWLKFYKFVSSKLIDGSYLLDTSVLNKEVFVKLRNQYYKYTSRSKKLIKQCYNIYMEQQKKITNIIAIDCYYQYYIKELMNSVNLFIPPGTFLTDRRLNNQMALFRILFLDNLFKKPVDNKYTVNLCHAYSLLDAYYKQRIIDIKVYDSCINIIDEYLAKFGSLISLRETIAENLSSISALIRSRNTIPNNLENIFFK
jgi:hypothetical protein